MASQGERTEQPTKQKLQKSRKEGQFPVSREFVGGVQFLLFVSLLVVWSVKALDGMRELMRLLLRQAFRAQFSASTLSALYRQVLMMTFLPLLTAGAMLMMASLAAHFGVTQFGFAGKKLAPDLTRLNPIQKLKDLPRQGFTSLLQVLILLPFSALVIYHVFRDNLGEFLALPLFAIEPALRLVALSFKGVLWKMSLVLLALGFLDLFRQRRRHAQSIRMTKQEVRQEHKESEGNPETKARVRRIQRDFARRNMMKEIPQATAVIVNPTHFAVAIRYEMEAMAAPRVVAKGKNYLALRIRQIAMDHQVPIVENQPLAQALYKSADVGQEIPPHLYRAVAEILAYIFKLMHPRKR